MPDARPRTTPVGSGSLAAKLIREDAASGTPHWGYMCECHYGEDFDHSIIENLADIIDHCRYSHVSPREMYRMHAERIEL
jgi:hypothetical protein